MKLDQIQNYNPNLPKLKANLYSIRWSLLFFVDQFFGFSAGKKDSLGNQLKKLESDSFISKRYKKLLEKNVKNLQKTNSKYKFEDALNLPSIDAENLNQTLFKHWRKKINTPLVVRGFLKGAPATDVFSIENLTTEFGDVEVTCVENLEKSLVGQNVNSAKTTMKDFLCSSEFNDFYINNFIGVLNESDFETFCKGNKIDKLQGQKNLIPQWFISRSKKQGSPLHCALGDNMFLNIKGKKEWHFIHPSYTPIIQASVAKYGVYAISELNDRINEDFYANIISEHPYFKHIPVFKVILNEGDLLFNPPWWWHSVRNKSDYTVGCATRYFEGYFTIVNSLTLFGATVIEFFKAPKKSGLYLAYTVRSNKNKALKMMDSIFPKKKASKD